MKVDWGREGKEKGRCKNMIFGGAGGIRSLISRTFGRGRYRLIV